MRKYADPTWKIFAELEDARDCREWFAAWEVSLRERKWQAAKRHIALSGYRGVVTALWLIALLRCLAA